MNLWRGRICIALLFSASGLASAHTNSQAFIHVHGQDDRVAGAWYVTAQDLSIPLELDRDRDLRITAREVAVAQADIEKIAQTALQFSLVGQGCALKTGAIDLADLSTKAFVRIHFSVFCTEQRPADTLTYTFNRALDPSHSALLVFASRQGDIVSLLNQNSNRARLSSNTWLNRTGSMFLQGIWHLLEGYDHLLFLITLMLPIWFGLSIQKQLHRIGETVKIVTAFSIAHSITLIMSTTKLWVIPTAWAEILIAISIILAAALSMLKWRILYAMHLAFAFGLVHGFGFANAMSELNLDSRHVFSALLGFNLGIEAGQLLVIALLWPLVFVCKTYLIGQHRLLLPSAAIAIMGVGVVLSWQRVMLL